MEEKSSIIKQFPNLLTAINILVGCLAITLAFEQNLLYAAYLVFIAGIIDFLDGFFARRLDAVSEFGKILDSLSDIICFGVTPGVIMYHILTMSLTFHNPMFSIESATVLDRVILYTSFLVVVFAGIRLARFSTERNNPDTFSGLPTPAMALFVASIALLFQETDSSQLRTIILNSYFLIILIVLLSLLMVSRLRLFSLKFQTLTFADNRIRYIFLLFSAVILILFGLPGIPLIIVFYILLSLVSNAVSSNG